MIQVTISQTIPEAGSIVLLAAEDSNFAKAGLSAEETDYVKERIKDKASLIALNRTGRWIFVQPTETKSSDAATKEKMRRAAAKMHQFIAQQKICSIAIVDIARSDIPQGKEAQCRLIAFAEGMALSNYQFLKYLSKKDEKRHSLTELCIVGNVEPAEIENLNHVLEAVGKTRDMVNEPGHAMTPDLFAAEVKAMGKEAGFDVQAFDKSAIESMNMGGILAVNRGSSETPTFTVLEWKPENAKNERPVVLVGKAITFDAGGHNLKTGDYMNNMKGDMAGGAAVAAVVRALAKSKIPVHVVGLIPATDNRLSADSFSPGDIIKISDGTTVEVMNTDVEGRIILADALTYAKQYKPELVVDIATLTGAAQRALGEQAMAVMGTASRETMNKLIECSESVHERMVEFPLWEEYGESLKSEIADIKNLGGSYAGMITAGKFLEHFTDYPYIHLDIAGVSFAEKADGYRSKGGTGIGVRLLYEFLKNYSK